MLRSAFTLLAFVSLLLSGVAFAQQPGNTAWLGERAKSSRPNNTAAKLKKLPGCRLRSRQPGNSRCRSIISINRFWRLRS
jgi:hypothetical protein